MKNSVEKSFKVSETLRSVEWNETDIHSHKLFSKRKMFQGDNLQRIVERMNYCMENNSYKDDYFDTLERTNKLALNVDQMIIHIDKIFANGQLAFTIGLKTWSESYPEVNNILDGFDMSLIELEMAINLYAVLLPFSWMSITRKDEYILQRHIIDQIIITYGINLTDYVKGTIYEKRYSELVNVNTFEVFNTLVRSSLSNRLKLKPLFMVYIKTLDRYSDTKDVYDEEVTSNDK